MLSLKALSLVINKKQVWFKIYFVDVYFIEHVKTSTQKCLNQECVCVLSMYKPIIKVISNVECNVKHLECT